MRFTEGPKTADVRLKLEGAFRAFGLPRFMLSDGGPPFGANGLGKPVVRALNTVNIPLGLEAGLAIVILAIILDRMSRVSTGGPQ